MSLADILTTHPSPLSPCLLKRAALPRDSSVVSAFRKLILSQECPLIDLSFGISCLFHQISFYFKKIKYLKHTEAIFYSWFAQVGVNISILTLNSYREIYILYSRWTNTSILYFLYSVWKLSIFNATEINYLSYFYKSSIIYNEGSGPQGNKIGLILLFIY